MFLLCSLLLQDFNSETASEALGWEARELLLWAAAGTRRVSEDPTPPGGPESVLLAHPEDWILPPKTHREGRMAGVTKQ